MDTVYSYDMLTIKQKEVAAYDDNNGTITLSLWG